MDTRNSALIAAFYVLGGVLVVLVALAYYSSMDRSGGGLTFTWDVSGPTTTGANVPGLPRPAGAAPGLVTPGTAATAAAPLRGNLQSSLAVTRDILEKRTQTLTEKNAECQALKEELDRSFQLIVSLLSNDPNGPDATGESTDEYRSKFQAEVEHLRSSLEKSRQLDAERQQQLLQLEAELLQADIDLAVVQQQAAEQLSSLTAEKRVVEDTTSEVFARGGMMVVPLLVDLLPDERVEIRRWATKTLGAIGPEALDALSELQALLTDPDPDVRERTQESIRLITGIPAPR